METKECRHCKQPIHKDARRCQHCQGMQGWISDQRDPRTLFLVFGILLVFFAAIYPMTRVISRPLERNDLAPSSLSIRNVSYRFGSGADSSHIFVSGEVSNLSDRDAGKTCLRVNLLGRDDRIVDSFVQSMDISIVPAKGTARFRLAAETPTRPEEIRKAEVTAERVRARGSWD